MGKDSMWYQSSATLRGRPTLFLFVVAVLDSAAGSTWSASSSVSGLGFFGGRPRLRLGGGSTVSSSAFLCGCGKVNRGVMNDEKMERDKWAR